MHLHISDPGKHPAEKSPAGIHSTSAKRLQGDRWEGSTAPLWRVCPVFQRFLYLLHEHSCSCYLSLFLSSVHNKADVESGVRARYARIPEGPLGRPRREERVPTWLISSSFCLCCSFRSPNAFPPAKRTQMWIQRAGWRERRWGER